MLHYIFNRKFLEFKRWFFVELKSLQVDHFRKIAHLACAIWASKKNWFSYLFRNKWILWVASGPLVSTVVFGRSFHRFYCERSRQKASCMIDISRSLSIAYHIQTHHLSKFLSRDQQTWNLKVTYFILNATWRIFTGLLLRTKATHLCVFQRIDSGLIPRRKEEISSRTIQPDLILPAFSCTLLVTE